MIEAEDNEMLENVLDYVSQQFEKCVQYNNCSLYGKKYIMHPTQFKAKQSKVDKNKKKTQRKTYGSTT